MSIAEHVIQRVESVAARERAGRVRRIILEIGELAAIEVEALRFCFAAVAAGGRAAGAQLEIDRVPGCLRCRACAEEFAAAELIAVCPACGGFAVDVVRGQEMRIREIEIEGEG